MSLGLTGVPISAIRADVFPLCRKFFYFFSILGGNPDNYFFGVASELIISRGNRCSISPPKRFYLRCSAWKQAPIKRSTDTPIQIASRVGPPEGGPNARLGTESGQPGHVDDSRLLAICCLIACTVQAVCIPFAYASHVICNRFGGDCMLASAWSMAAQKDVKGGSHPLRHSKCRFQVSYRKIRSKSQSRFPLRIPIDRTCSMGGGGA